MAIEGGAALARRCLLDRRALGVGKPAARDADAVARAPRPFDVDADLAVRGAGDERQLLRVRDAETKRRAWLEPRLPVTRLGKHDGARLEIEVPGEQRAESPPAARPGPDWDRPAHFPP